MERSLFYVMLIRKNFISIKPDAGRGKTEVVLDVELLSGTSKDFKSFLQKIRPVNILVKSTIIVEFPDFVNINEIKAFFHQIQGLLRNYNRLETCKGPYSVVMQIFQGLKPFVRQ